MRFKFNLDNHWVKLLFRQPGIPPVTLMCRERFTQGDNLSVVLYGISLIHLVEDLWAAYPGLLTPFYADDVVFYGLARQSFQIMKLLFDRITYQGYFPEPAKLLYIVRYPAQEAAARWKDYSSILLEAFSAWGRIWILEKSWRHGCGPK